MSAYRIANNTRELQLMGVGAARGMRTMLMGIARAACGSSRATYVRTARETNHDLVRRMRAAREAQS
jgi:CTP synthase (UTP-ammonia lyase)